VREQTVTDAVGAERKLSGCIYAHKCKRWGVDITNWRLSNRVN